MKRLTALLISITWALAACENPATRPDEREPSASSVGVAAALHVNSTTDAVDAQPGDGVCRTAAGTCTLRAAIQEANARPGADVITVPAGTYRITHPEPANGGIAGGDFNITAPVEITGAGAARTMVDGNHQFRILNVKSGATGRVTLTKLTIQNGAGDDECGPGVVQVFGVAALRKVTVRGNCGSGIVNQFGSTLTVDRSTITANGTSWFGGGIDNHGTLLITRSTMSDNYGQDGGGAINNFGTLTVVNSTVSGNGSDVSGGGINTSGRVTLNNVTITGNIAGGQGHGGGGIDGSGTLTVSNTIIAANREYLPGGDPEYRPSDCEGTLTSAGYNLIGTTTECTITGNRTGNKTGNARLGPLQNNGGSTLTHALLAGSPAINAGNPAPPSTKEPKCILKDQRLLPRTNRCDIGSFEVQGP